MEQSEKEQVKKLALQKQVKNRIDEINPNIDHFHCRDKKVNRKTIQLTKSRKCDVVGDKSSTSNA